MNEEVHENLQYLDSEESLTLNSTMSSFRDLPVSVSTEYASYFKRPIEVLQFTIASTDTRASRWSTTWPNTQINTIFNSKLRGVSYLRADITARLQVNANIAQAGIYRFYAIPIFQNNSLCWTATASTTSCLPHVDVKLSCVRSAELKLPWVFPPGAIQVGTPMWEIGLMPLAPLKTGTGDADANCSLWIVHDSFETYGSSGLNTFQSGVQRKEMKDQGYISRYLTKFSRMFNALQPIPIIGSYMPAMSTVSDSLASAAKVWGLSAPYISKPPRKVISYNSSSMAVGTEPFGGRMMAVSDLNSTPMFKRTGNMVDEMAIPYIVGKYWYFTTSTMRDTQSPGTLLWNMNVQPSQMFVAYTQASFPSTFALSPLLILTRLGKFWRGSIKYRFNFAVTKMHTGRVVVTFGSKNSAGAPNETFYRKVVDLSEVSSFEFTVPYLFPHNVFPTESLGAINLWVDEGLKNPSMVANEVDFTVEIAGGDDFEIIGFRGDDYNGEVNPPIPRTANFVFQSGCFAEEHNFEEQNYNPEVSLITAGEKVVSLRTLCKVFCRRISFTTSTAGAISSVGSIVSGSSMSIRDHFVFNPASGSNILRNTFFTRLSSAYYGSFGGLRARTVGNVKRTYKCTDFAIQVSDLGGITQVLTPSEELVPVQIPYSSRFNFVTPNSGENGGPELFNTNSCRLAVDYPADAQSFECFEAAADDFDCQLFLGWPLMTTLAYPTSL